MSPDSRYSFSSSAIRVPPPKKHWFPSSTFRSRVSRTRATFRCRSRRYSDTKHSATEPCRKFLDQSQLHGLQSISFDKTPVALVKAPRIRRGEEGVFPVPAQYLDFRLAI